MANGCSVEILLILVCFFTIIDGHSALPQKIFNVRNYGAVADGKTDNTQQKKSKAKNSLHMVLKQVFLKTWRDACAYSGRSRFLIPRGTYLLGSISFVGPCKGSMAFLIKGTLRATTVPAKFFTNTWIGFRYLNDLTVKGGGILDGQGHAAWRYNDCSTNKNCKSLPTTLRFDFINNSTIHHIRSINSKNSHINIFACYNLNISYIRLTAPGDSPNTDGIRIGTSSKIQISNSVIGTGDDCIAMISGSQNIDISKVHCGPGHGISIGSLGRSHANEYVKGIRVRNCTITGADNGVRIKTWATSLHSIASDLSFQDIVMRNTRNPIIIDQEYCPHNTCNKGSSSAVQIRDVTFSNIWGISNTKVALSLKCSQVMPCRNVKLININLAYHGHEGPATSLCSNVKGFSYGKQKPGGCL